MSSKELKTIYRNASSLVSLRLKGLSGVDRVMSECRDRAISEKAGEKLSQRSIIDPVHFSQRINVPKATVDSVVGELRRLNLVHVWVRGTCPNVADDDNVIVETNSEGEFRTALSEPCPHCGVVHKRLDWNYIETFYVLNSATSADSLELGRFFISPERVEVPLRNRPPDRLIQAERHRGWVSRFFHYWAGKPASDSATDIVLDRLSLNDRAARVPSSGEIAWKLVNYTFGWAIFSAVAFIVCRWLFGYVMALIVLAIFLVAMALSTWVTLRAIYAASAVQRGLVSVGYLLAVAVLGSSFTCKLQVGEDIPFRFDGGLGEPNVPLCFLSAFVFTVTTVGVVLIPVVNGWYSRSNQ